MTDKSPEERYATGVREIAGFWHMDTRDYALCLCAYYLQKMYRELVDMGVELKYLREEVRDKCF